MILDRLDKCPACFAILTIIGEYGSMDKFLSCKSCLQNNFKGPLRFPYLWAFYSLFVKIDIINIRIKKYQLQWRIDQNITRLFVWQPEKFSTSLVKVDGLIDFELTKINIENKIKTMLTFM